MMYTGA